MKRFSWSLFIAAAVLGGPQPPSPEWKVRPVRDRAGRLRVGGSYNMDFGDLHVDDSFGYGVMLNFLAARGTALELTYLRQDTKLRFDPTGQAEPATFPPTSPRTISIWAGAVSSDTTRRSGPSLTAPSASPCSISRNRGSTRPTSRRHRRRVRVDVRQRAALRPLRGHIRGWFSFVPSDDYFYWCTWYGCGASQGSETVARRGVRRSRHQVLSFSPGLLRRRRESFVAPVVCGESRC
jgi:hypothetical protein